MNSQISSLSSRSIRWLTVLMAAGATVCMVTSAQGYDGKRKGFVSGAGVGLTPVAQFAMGSVHEDGLAIGENILIGYGWNEQNVIAFEMNSSIRHSDYYSEIGHRTHKWFSEGMHGDQMVYQIFGGVTWYHYFRQTAFSPFVVGGLGGYNMMPSSLGGNSPGFGWLLGAGYALSGHFQVGLYYCQGKSSDGSVQFTHRQLSLLVTYVQF